MRCILVQGKDVGCLDNQEFNFKIVYQNGFAINIFHNFDFIVPGLGSDYLLYKEIVGKQITENAKLQLILTLKVLSSFQKVWNYNIS